MFSKSRLGAIPQAVSLLRHTPKAVAVDGRVLFDSVLGKYTSYNVLKSENTAINFVVEKELDGYYFEGERIDDNGNAIYVYKSKDNPDEKMELTAEEALEEKTIDVGKIIYEPGIIKSSPSK